jgi:hypothetical protein
LSTLGRVWPRGRLSWRDSITLFHILSFFHRFLGREKWRKKKKFLRGQPVPDQINRTSLFKTFLMMCWSTSDLSLLVWMQFFPNHQLWLQVHTIPCPSQTYTSGTIPPFLSLLPLSLSVYQKIKTKRFKIKYTGRLFV